MPQSKFTLQRFPAGPRRLVGPRLLALLLVVAGLVRTASPVHAAEPALKWFKGNLHTHSLWSDGNDFPEMITDWYAARDYHFLALSDHNLLSKGERWMNLRDVNRRGFPLALSRYQERFGKDWVELRGEGDKREVRLRGLEEFRGKFEKPGAFLLIQSEEITDKFDKYPIHINATNIQEMIKPQGGKSVQDVMRRNLEAVREQSQRTGQPILPHLNHPNFGWGVSAEDLAAVLLERFFEVYNGHPGVNQQGDGGRAGIDRLWDIANTLRIAKHQSPPLYGIGTDDSHNYQAIGQTLGPATPPAPVKDKPVDAKDKAGASAASAPVDPLKAVPAGSPMRRAEPGRGWSMVRAANLDAKSLIDAMIRGDHYASSGVTLVDVRFTPGSDGKAGTLELEIAAEAGVNYTTQFIGTRKGVDLASEPLIDKAGKEIYSTRRYSAEIGKVLAEVKGEKPSYQLTGDELYVRALVTATKPAANPSYPGQLQQAWTQPVGWEKWVK